ncbi:hypothetical protein QEN19_001327 [Hanseniaspora menglaensis]
MLKWLKLCFFAFFFIMSMVDNLTFCFKIDDYLNLDNNSTTSLLTLFNMTRTVGSKNSKLTRDIITNFYNNLPLRWKIETHTFKKSVHEFNNLIITLPYYNDYKTSLFLHPMCDSIDLANDLILAAHYDTLSTIPNFVGAVDSAASMSILLYLSLYISENAMDTRKRNIKIIFFDGEEAFDHWTEDDSLYGSKELANIYRLNNLTEKIDLFILLDLLGSSENDGFIYNYFNDSRIYYDMLLLAEAEIRESTSFSLLDSKYDVINLSIEDDHVPFKRNGVKCLHLIPYPFPSFWHTAADNFEHLDSKAIKHMALLLINFTISFVSKTKI